MLKKNELMMRQLSKYIDELYADGMNDSIIYFQDNLEKIEDFWKAVRILYKAGCIDADEEDVLTSKYIKVKHDFIRNYAKSERGL